MRYRLDAMCGQRTPVVIRAYQVWQTRYGAGSKGLFSTMLAACHKAPMMKKASRRWAISMGLLVFPDIFDDTSCPGEDDGLVTQGRCFFRTVGDENRRGLALYDVLLEEVMALTAHVRVQG